ncbi:PHP domain-containing protein [Streptomyces sp. NPDC017993]|uniref:PHP domain-containing protein n=1 Tax=Streptomyces sp. NPDC017993 TaxID=3365027 RepID=UPI003789A761
MPGFTHLHTASAFSVRYGASRPERLVERAAERSMDALALTDRDGLTGALRFAKAAAEAGVRPLFGAELAVVEGKLTHSGSVPRRSPAAGAVSRAVFLARDGAAGWAALCRLVSAAHAERPERPVLPWGALESAPAGLSVLLGPDSEVGRALAAGRPDRAARLVAPWRERYGETLRLEVVDHGRTGGGPGSRRLAARTLGFAVAQGLRAVLTNAVRYADPGQAPVADVLDAVRRSVPVDHRPEGRDSGERWLKDAAAMSRAAERIAEAAGFRRDLAHRLLAMTEEAAGECRVDPEGDLGLGRVHVCEPRPTGARHRTAARVLRSRCAAGMVLRGYDRDRERWSRLDEELRVIERLDLSSYFLMATHAIGSIRQLDIRYAARGDGAGSLVNHLLGIAHADPVAHGLPAEPFLSERRTGPPGIDIDIESARRPAALRALIDRFGTERVAAVSMPETYRVRHAVRDVGAALGAPPELVDRLASAFPRVSPRDARTAAAGLPELRGVREAGGERLWELVEALDGLPRGRAVHPSGVLISGASLLDRTPVLPAGAAPAPGRDGAGAVPLAWSLFDRADAADLGLLTLDVRGVRAQSAMAHAVAEIGRATGRRPDLDDPVQVPPDDPATYDLIRSTDTLGCPRIESPGGRELIGQLQPAAFPELVLAVSLYRPGPAADDVARPVVEARHGRRAARPAHPDLEEPLRGTYGVMVFQEQLIETLRIMTGCTREEAEGKRRALAHPEARGRVRSWFAARAERRGYAPEVIAQAWGSVEDFGAYDVSKAHAVAFALPVHQSAWLKAHHPAAFYAGLLTHDPGRYPKRLLLADARRRGVPVLAVDVNRSSVTHRIELVSGSAQGGAVWGLRLALFEVHGIGAAEARRIEAGRPYLSLQDLWQRARPGHPVAERLARVGALDAFGANRRDLLLHIAELDRRGPGGSGRTGRPSLLAPADLSDVERLSADLGILGTGASRHLMADHQEFLTELGALSAALLREVRDGETVLVAGAKTATRTAPDGSGRGGVRTTLDDGTGLIHCAFLDIAPGPGGPADPHGRGACAQTVLHSWLLLVRGTVQQHESGSFSVFGGAVWNLAELAELRRQGGLEAVTARLAEGPRPTAGPAGPGAADHPDAGPGGAAGAHPADAAAAAPGRTIQLETGHELPPGAGLQPSGARAATARKLWHASPGSAG